MVKPKFEAVNNWCLLEDDIIARSKAFNVRFWSESYINHLG